MDAHSVGAAGEEIAVGHLQAAGLEIVERNWRCAQGQLRGEIDIVAWEGDVLALCEVKTRRGHGAGGPLAAVTPRKVAQLRRLAGAYLAASPLRPAGVRLDVVGVLLEHGRPPDVIHLRDVG